MSRQVRELLETKEVKETLRELVHRWYRASIGDDFERNDVQIKENPFFEGGSYIWTEDFANTISTLDETIIKRLQQPPQVLAAEIRE